MKCAVVGIPKTVDNDLMFIDRSFGFETAVQRAKETVAAVHMEAASQINGIGLVKLMGREAGFIAAAAALSSHETNFCLIPEVPFEMEGENGFLAALERRLAKRGHAVIVVSEGAGQDLLTSTNATDASGNKKLADIGVFLKTQIEKYFKEKKIEINLKYIDPSYQVRACVTTAFDSIYCERLGNNAVHAAMAGKTKLVIGLVHDQYVHLPIKAVTAHRNAIDPEGNFWRDTLDATGQQILMVNDLANARAKMASAVAGAKSKPSEQKKAK
jgi:6-phosphofructokinase 1